MIRKLYKKTSRPIKRLANKLYNSDSLMKHRFSLYSNKPIKENLIIFECNLGHGYYGNLRAIYEAMLKDPKYSGYQFIWSVNKYISYQFLLENERTDLVKVRTSKWLRAFAEAKYIITNKPICTCIKKKERAAIYPMF